MMLTFSWLATFEKERRQLRIADESLQELEADFLADPTRWPVVPGTGGFRKARFAPTSQNAGRSGAFRVLYLHLPLYSIVYVALIYGKGVKVTLTAADKKLLKAYAERLAAYHVTQAIKFRRRN